MDTKENHGAAFTGEKLLYYKYINQCKDSSKFNGLTGTCETFKTLKTSSRLFRSTVLQVSYQRKKQEIHKEGKFVVLCFAVLSVHACTCEYGGIEII